MGLLYFTILAGAWLVVWSAVFLLITRPADCHKYVWQPVYTRWFLILFVMGAPFTYLTGYPACLALSQKMPITAPLLDIFVPVEWLVDHTPARFLVQEAAQWWNVSSRISAASESRLQRDYWGQWPWLSAGGELVLVITAVVLPPILVSRWFHKVDHSTGIPPTPPSNLH